MKVKTFKTKTAYDKWISLNSSKYQIEDIFLNNVNYAVEYKKLVKPTCFPK